MCAKARDHANYTPVSPEAPAVRLHPPLAALTKENRIWGRLDRELGDSLRLPKYKKLRVSSLGGGQSSMDVSHENPPVGSTLGELEYPGRQSRHQSWMHAARKRLFRNDSDQIQRTVTPVSRDDRIFSSLFRTPQLPPSNPIFSETFCSLKQFRCFLLEFL